MNEALISDSGRRSPVVVQRRDGGGIVLSCSYKLLALSPTEVERLVTFIEGDPTAVTPAKARLLRYPVVNDA